MEYWELLIEVPYNSVFPKHPSIELTLLSNYISLLECRLCFGLSMWNGKDPILKERLFGLTGQEVRDRDTEQYSARYS